jgi:signal transduction histidine kinase
MGIFSSLRKYFLPGELSAALDASVVPHFLVDGKFYLPGKQQAEEVTVIARWLVRLRWVAISGFLLLAGCFWLFFPSMMPIPALLGLCGIIFLYNLAFSLLFKTRKTLTSQAAIVSIRLQVFLDWLALLLFIHFTGGIFSPLVFFVILHVIIDAMIFSPSQCYLYTALLLVGLGVLVIIEYVAGIFPVNSLWLGPNPPPLEPLPMLIAFFLFSFVLFCATFLATSIMGRFREREMDVRRLSGNLQKALTRMETLYEATRAMVTSYDLTAVLDIIVQDSARIMGAKGAAVHLVQEGTQELTLAATWGLSDEYLQKGPITTGDGLTPKSPDDVIVVEDVEADQRLKYPKEDWEEGIRSIISIPLVRKGKIMGDLRIYAQTQHRYTEDEVSFLRILAGGAAVIIDNAQAWKALEESNRRIISFAYKISHDLKSPVVAIQSLLSAMQCGFAGEVPPKQKEILDRCINKQEQLLQLIRDLLNLAEGQMSLEGQKMLPIQLDAIAAESIKLLETVSQERKILMNYQHPQHAIAFHEVPGDFQRLFSNLLDNALRYTPAGGRVELVLGDDDEKISIMVKDSGIGIEPEHKEKIFDEFFRTPQAKQCRTDGTGLGLAIVKGIVQRYHGTVRVESELGKGTAFYVTLPRG